MSPLGRRVRLVVFALGLPAILAVYGAILFPIRVANLISPPLARRLVRRVAASWVRVLTGWALRVCRMSLAVEGPRPEVRAGPLIVVSNHQSVMDIAILCRAVLPAYPTFIAKEQLRRFIPNISPAGRIAGTAFISRRQGDIAQLKRIRALGRQIEAERTITVIFAEGTRSRDGALGPFRSGGLGALLAAAPSARVLPVAIDGTHRAATFASILSHLPGLAVRLRYGEPFEVPAAARGDPETARAVADRCRAFCEKALAEWRGTDR